ncbi:MAG: PAS domain-containing protein [Leptospira sp.]|nr:PAS domain-containing protein [Leptospira sp.]
MNLHPFILQSILENTEDSVAIIDRNFDYICFNQNYFKEVERIYNRKIEIGQNVHDFITNSQDVEVSKQNFGKCLNGEVIVVTNRYGNEEFETSVFEVKLFPFRNDNDHVEGIIIWTKNISEKDLIQIENNLIKTRLENAESSARMCSWEVDVITGGGWWSNNMFNIFGFPLSPTPPTLEEYLEHVHEEDRSIAMSAVDFLLKGEIPDPLEYRTNPRYTEMRVVLPTYQNVKIESGAVVKIMGTIIDITDLKHAQEKISNLLEEKDLLLKEVLHRINNNMSILLSILNLQSANTTDMQLKTILRDIESRIQSMNILYNKLFRMQNIRQMPATEYFISMLGDIKSIYKVPSGIIFDLRIDDIYVNAKVLFSLGLIVNELLSNCLKYAFVKSQTGVILFQMTKSKEGEIILVVEDNGNWIESDKSSKSKSGFGLELVSLLARQLQAKWNVKKDHGTRYEFRFIPND